MTKASERYTAAEFEETVRYDIHVQLRVMLASKDRTFAHDVAYREAAAAAEALGEFGTPERRAAGRVARNAWIEAEVARRMTEAGY